MTFLSLDGVDGAGKSTQIRLLVDWLTRQGRDVVSCRDPGGTPTGDEIRRLLLDPEMRISLRSEMLLYMASRAQLVTEVIQPALDRGSVVVCDRYLLSTLVYQGHAGGLDVEDIRAVGAFATTGLMPDWTGVIDLAPETAAQRRDAPADRIEQRDRSYHEKVRRGFQAEVEQHADRMSLFDGRQAAEEIHQAIIVEVQRVLDRTRRP
ncbi:Thymidylate kinase [Planctomycetes bacterium Pan216]|uniref:Thymidylate kinase n=1 Tax=Kolteria novifilia TaxID=2527975 RepID=A0A518BA36_9BACT|nr:Thymidylate kinase [Planctomycetes bacterium Pan216]